MLKKYLLFFLFIGILAPFTTSASYCVEEVRGKIKMTNMPVDQCTTGMIILSKTEYDAIRQDGIIATLKSLFEFSVEDFALFNAICLIGFITTHSVGRVVRYMGKT